MVARCRNRNYSTFAERSGRAVLIRGSATTLLLRLRVPMSPESWMSFSCDCCVMLRRVLCDGPIPRPEESYRGWYVWVWIWRLVNEEALAHFQQLCHEGNGGIMHVRERKSILDSYVMHNDFYAAVLNRWAVYRFIHKSLRDFRTRLLNNQDRHGRKEHINR